MISPRRLLSVVAGVAVAVALSAAVDLNYDCSNSPCWPTLTTQVQGGDFDDVAPVIDVTGIEELTLNVTFVGADDVLTFQVVEPNMEGGWCRAQHLTRDNDGDIIYDRVVEYTDFETNTPATDPYTVTITVPVAPYSVPGVYERYILCIDRIGNFLEVELPELTVISPFLDYEDPWVVEDSIVITGPSSVDINSDCYAHGMTCATFSVSAFVTDEPDNSTYESGVVRAFLAVRLDAPGQGDRYYEMNIVASTAAVTFSFENDDIWALDDFWIRSIYTVDGAGNVGQTVLNEYVSVDPITYDPFAVPACTKLVISDTTSGSDTTAASIEVTITCTLGSGTSDTNYGFTQWRTSSDVALEEVYANSGDPLTYLWVNSDEVAFTSATQWVGVVEFPIQGPNVQWELEYVEFTTRAGMQVLYDDCICDLSSASPLSSSVFVVAFAAAAAWWMAL